MLPISIRLPRDRDNAAAVPEQARKFSSDCPTNVKADLLFVFQTFMLEIAQKINKMNSMDEILEYLKGIPRIDGKPHSTGKCN